MGFGSGRAIQRSHLEMFLANASLKRTERFNFAARRVFWVLPRKWHPVAAAQARKTSRAQKTQGFALTIIRIDGTLQTVTGPGVYDRYEVEYAESAHLLIIRPKSIESALGT